MQPIIPDQINTHPKGTILSRLVRLFLRTATVLCLVALIWGRLGAFHPSGDTVELGTPFFAALGILFSLSFFGHLRFIMLGIFLAWFAVWLFAIIKPTGPTGDLSLYQKNVWIRNQNPQPLAEDIIASGADFVTLQELPQNGSLVAALRSSYPHQLICPHPDSSGLAVLSKHAFVEGSQTCSKIRLFAAVQIATPHGPVWVASLHLFWPYPYSQAKSLGQVEHFLKSLDGPVIIGGDLNMHPATRVSRRIASLSGSQELRPVFPTLYQFSVPLFLDHIFAPSGKVERRPRLGSDHFGLVGRVSLTKIKS